MDRVVPARSWVACVGVLCLGLAACSSVDPHLLRIDAGSNGGAADAAHAGRGAGPAADAAHDAGGDGSTRASDAATDANPGASADAGTACRRNPDTSDEVCPEICPEQCNDADDDCDRRIDERPAADRACALFGAAAVCQRGSCVIASCDDGYRDCDGEAANGCEASLDAVAHCGGCATACTIAHAEPACVARACVVSSCHDAWDDCDADGQSCETPLDTLSDCGGCGSSCGGLADATPDCAGGSCAIGACLGNHDDCDGKPANGCETSLDTLADCGGCDAPCALAACAGGVCSAMVCIDPTADCDGDGVDCEVDLATDLLNCGGCNRPCAFTSATPNASLACVAKDCVANCDPGWDDCDESYATGCETAVNLPARCGDCATDCGATLAHVSTTACHATTFTCEVVGCATDWGDCDHVHATGCEESLLTTTNCGGCASDGANEPCQGLAQVTTSTCATGVCAIAACDTGFDDCDGLAANGCEQDLALGGACALRKRITLDADFVDAPLVSFPVLVRVTDAELQKARADGLDFVFTDAGGGVLDHEIESWNGASGALVAWVRLPAISDALDTTFHLYYGDGVARAANPTGVWDASFKYVWHMAQDPSASTMKDATGTGAHATSSGSMTSTDLVAAVVGKGIDFDGSNDRLLFGNSFTGAGPHTIATWVSQRSSGSGDDAALYFGTATTGDARILFTSKTGGAIRLSFQSNTVDTNDDIRNLGWKHVVWTHDGSLSTLYLDAALAYGPSSPGGTNSTSGTNGEIGAHANGDWLNGQLDELRVSTAVRSVAWIKAEYQNQRAGSTFLVVGPEQKAPPLS